MQTRWPYFPIFLKLAGRRVLVVGGGEVALRKIRLLLRSGARIEVAARELLPEMASLEIAHIAGEFEPGQLRGCALALAASDDAALRWVTANAAWALGLEGEIGTLEKGKLASAVPGAKHAHESNAANER